MARDQHKETHIVRQFRMPRMPLIEALKDQNEIKSNKIYIFLNHHNQNKMNM